ncbi:DUF4489 domain-containing protein [Wukongibacter baidiensis]|uniref:DUF4489 domain-containing protein n=1 Tax=Wukongibacter baidiensis TaxID=1723361 RepID=UPI003D7FAE75
MTYNHTYKDHKACEPNRDLAKSKQKHTKSKKILLECGSGTGSTTFTSSSEGSFQIANVTVSTTGLDRNEVLIKFSSIVNMSVLTSGATIRLKYELFKKCRGREPQSLGTWMFEEIDVSSSAFQAQEESFSFVFCDCITCTGCFEYFVTVTPIEIEGSTATVGNGRMAALSSSPCGGTKSRGKHPRPKEVVLACGEGNGSMILREDDDEPFGIAHITLNTTCFIKPKALIEFSSIIKIDSDISDIRLQFELFRVCSDGRAVSRGIWTFERTGISADVNLEKAFDFTFCECEIPCDCCEYFVTVTSLEIIGPSSEADVVVDNARMVALAQSAVDFDDCKILDGKSDCTDCVPERPKAKEILLECGVGTGSRTFSSSNEPAFQLAQVTIDTTQFCKPMVNIEFSSIVSFNRLSTLSDARLRYELFRVCDNKKPISIGVWVLERVINDGDLGKSTNIFNFTFCDCISCPGCCDYFVTVTPIEITEGGITVTVNNGRMAALAQEGHCNHNYMEKKSNKSLVSCTKCKEKPTKPKKILLECGEGTGSRTFTSSGEIPFQLAHVTLDTTCLYRPEVLIKFSSIVNIERLIDGATARLRYELFRVCDDEEAKFLGTWMFEEVNIDSVEFDRQEESFSFIFCERITYPGCYDYFVRVTPSEIEGATATVSDGRMAALSKPLRDRLEVDCKKFDSKQDDTKLGRKQPNPKKIMLACGQGNGSVVFRRDLAATIDLDPPVNIAHVTLDTTCLVKPKVLIEFSSIIKLDNDVTDIRLKFELFRVNGEEEPLSLGTWNFARTGVSNDFIELDKAFDFTFCECEAPRGCCEYFVTITPLEIVIADQLGPDIVVDNARMVAFAQSSSDLDGCKIIDKKSKCMDCAEKHPSAKKIVFECGEGTGSKTFTSANESAFQLAWVTLDTTYLINPMVNIEFSSIISFEGSGDARLRYELFRVCDNREPVSLGIWVSERIGQNQMNRATNIFNFTFCNCISCPGCCDYFVTVTLISIASRPRVTVSNGRIAALAQER